MVKWKETIVNGIVAHFGANITNFQTRIRSVINSASYWTEEWLYSVIFVFNNHSRENHCMRTNLTKGSGPELGCSNVRRMNHKFIFLFVKSGRRFKASYVWPVAQFSLHIASNNMKIIDQRQPSFVLLFTSKEGEWLGKHTLMKMYWWRSHEQVGPSESQLFLVTIFREVLTSKNWVAVESVNNSPPLGHLIVSAIFKETHVYPHFWFLVDKVGHLTELFVFLFAQNKTNEFVLVKINL